MNEDNADSLFRNKLKAHSLEVWILYEHDLSYGSHALIVKVKLNPCRGISKEISLFFRQREYLGFHDLFLVVADPRRHRCLCQLLLVSVLTQELLLLATEVTEYRLQYRNKHQKR